MMDDEDYAMALQLQEEFNGEMAFRPPLLSGNTKYSIANSQASVSKGDVSEHRVVDDDLELSDPTPDIHTLFLQFDRLYFDSKLENVEVRWSPRMTLCAGVCCYEGHGGLCSIRLSKPLLALRPRKDLVQTLLHEMIHAYLFVTHNNKDHDAHGPEFLEKMNRINRISGANVTVFHTFHDEVDSFRTHWWQCDGPCRQRSPYYGIVKRSTNRAPAPRDPWWDQHQSSCGGTFTKMKEPIATKAISKRTKKGEVPKGSVRPADENHKQQKTEPHYHDFVPFSGTGHRLVKEKDNPSDHSRRQRHRAIDSYFTKVAPKVVEDFVLCPVCGTRVSKDSVNVHLDHCLGI